MKTTGRYIRPSVRYVVLIMCNDPMLSMKLTAENGQKNVTVQGHKFSDLPTALETNKPRRKVLETSPRGGHFHSV